MKTYYAIWTKDQSGNYQKWFGNMKRWQAYYLAFHLWILFKTARNKRKIIVKGYV